MIDTDELKEILGSLNEELKGSFFFQGSQETWSDVRMWIPTGCTVLDYALTSYGKDGKPLGRGWACGRWYEIFGPEAGGKTTLYLEGMVECQKMGGYAVLIDSECRLYKPRAERMGLDLSRLTIVDAPYIEKGIEALVKLLDLFKKSETLSRKPVFIAWDTIATVPTKAEFEGGAYAGGMAGKPRAIHQMIKDLVSRLPQSNACLILVNQVRDNIGATKYQAQTDTTGGWGPRFQSSVRIETQKIGAYNHPVRKDETEGIITRYKFVKSSLFKPYGEVEVALSAEDGIDDLISLVNFHVAKSKLISTKGGRYKCEEYQGKDATGKYLGEFLNLVQQDDLFVDFLKMRVGDHTKQFWARQASYGNKEDKES